MSTIVIKEKQELRIYCENPAWDELWIVHPGEYPIHEYTSTWPGGGTTYWIYPRMEAVACKKSPGFGGMYYPHLASGPEKGTIVENERVDLYRLDRSHPAFKYERRD